MLATAVALLCVGVGRAQDLPSSDFGSLPDANSLTNLPDVPGDRPGSVGGSVLSMATSGVSGALGAQVSTGVSGMVDPTVEGALRSSSGGVGGASGTASAWQASGFRVQAASARSIWNLQPGSTLYSAPASVNGDASLPGSFGSAAGSGAAGASQVQVDLLSLDRAAQAASNPLLTSDVPDLAAAADSAAGDVPSLVPSFGEAMVSSVQSPAEGLQFSILDAVSHYSPPPARARRRSIATAHDRLAGNRVRPSLRSRTEARLRRGK